MSEFYKDLYAHRLKLNCPITVSSIFTMYYFDFTANYQSGREKHPFWEFVYVDNGSVVATADDSTYVINKGEIIFHKPGELHSVKCDGITPANIFIMTFAANGRAMNTFKNSIVKVPYNLQGLLAAIVNEMQAAYGSNPGFIKQYPTEPFGAEQMIKTYLEQFLILLKRSIESDVLEQGSYTVFKQHNSTTTNKLVADVITQLENKIYGNVTIEELCQFTNYGKSQLCDTFKKATGKTIIQYYTELKINEAKMLIREQRLNNAQISDKLFFSSPQYFTRVFKQITSMTPREYMQSIKF